MHDDLLSAVMRRMSPNNVQTCYTAVDVMVVCHLD